MEHAQLAQGDLWDALRFLPNQPQAFEIGDELLSHR
jgi:hypothetical protein